MKNLVAAVKELLGEEFVVTSEVHQKQDGPRSGITIRKAGDAIGMILYPAESFEVEDEAKKLVNAYKRAGENPQITEDDISFILKWETAKPYLKKRLVSKERSAELLKTVPYKDMEDLAVIYYISVSDCGTVIVTDNMVQGWGVTYEEVTEAAQDEEFEIIGLNNILEESGEGEDVPTLPMLVVSNPRKISGASAVLNPDCQEILQKTFGEYFVIPSSTHEVIIMPKQDAEGEVEYLRSMIREVNATQLSPEEVLSDNLFVIENGVLKAVA